MKQNVITFTGSIFLLFMTGYTLVRGQATISLVAPGAQVSILVADVNSGEILCDLNSGMLMIPASTLKISTTAAAYYILGSDFQYSTRIYTRGRIRNNTLHGDIIVVGNGDPTLGSAFFLQTSPLIILGSIRESLERKGIKYLNGKIIINHSIIPEPRYPAGRLWEDMGNYYGAAPSGLTWRDNTFEIDLSSPTMPGRPCKIVGVRHMPESIEFISYVYSAANNKDSAYIYGYPGLSRWEIRGTIPAGRPIFTIRGALPDPAWQFATELRNELSSRKSEIEIESRGTRMTEIPSSFSLLLEIRSPALHEIVKVINQRSHNLMADHLFLYLGTDTGEVIDGWRRSSVALNNFWKKNGITGTGRVRDGSGLSPKNLVNARFIVDILRFISNSDIGHAFKSTMAVNGKLGTLENSWLKPGWEERVVAKSGSMEGVSCYAGFIHTRGNRELAFTIMVNNFTCPPGEVRKRVEHEIGLLIDAY